VLIRRFAYKGTVEEAIVDLHSAQRAGAVSMRDLQDCGGARSVTRNTNVKKVPQEVLQAFERHGVGEPHRLDPRATTEEPIRKDTGVTRHDCTTGGHEAVWEWFTVKQSRCLDCGEAVQLSGLCIFRGLASERAAKEAEIERCERRLRRVAEYKQRLTTKEYRTGKKQLTELQEAELDKEDWITTRLEELNEKMVGTDGVEHYTHPAATAAGGGASHFRAGSSYDSSDESDESEEPDDRGRMVFSRLGLPWHRHYGDSDDSD